MPNRNTLRIAFLSGIIGLAGVAGAQSKAPGGGGGGGAKPAGGGGASASPSRGGGGGNNASPPAQSGSRDSGGSNSGGTSAGRNDSKPSGTVPRNDVVRSPGGNQSSPGRNDGSQFRGPGDQQNRVAPNPGRQTPANAEEARKIAERQRATQDSRNRTPVGPADRTITVNAGNYPGLNTWGPYTWWYSGNSYWWPPVDYRDDVGTQQNTYSDGSAGSTTAVAPPAADLLTPAQVRAQSLNQLEGLPEYRQLIAELKKTQNAYETASARALEKVKANPEYQALVKERDQAGHQVEAVQASAKLPNPDAVTPVAEKKLGVSTKITRMEQDAIAADPQASTAKARMVDINERLTAMRKQAQGAAVPVR